MRLKYRGESRVEFWEDDDKDFPYLRRTEGTWERLMCESWEAEYDDEALERMRKAILLMEGKLTGTIRSEEEG